MKAWILGVAVALAAAGAPVAPAHATAILFNWSYTGSAISASGTFDTQTTATPSAFLITSISGQRNGSAITGLDQTFGNPDQLLFFPATDTGTALNPTQLDNNGFSYDIGMVAYNIFTSGSRPTVVENDNGPAIVFSAVPASVPVPEPASVLLLAAGLLGLGLARRYLT